MPDYLSIYTRMQTHVCQGNLWYISINALYVFLYVLGGELRGSMGKFPK